MKVRIEQKIIESLEPDYLEVIDESHKHKGHVGNPDGKGETHFKIIISNNKLGGLSKIDAHRKVYGAIGADMQSIHALSIEII